VRPFFQEEVPREKKFEIPKRISFGYLDGKNSS